MLCQTSALSRLNLFDCLLEAIKTGDIDRKCEFTLEILDHYSAGKYTLTNQTPPITIPIPGLPERVTLVPPRKLKRRGIQNQTGRLILIHAIAHIEFNAINLALDAAYRFRDQPEDFYLDWLTVAADEARHFKLLEHYLNQHGCRYGDYPAHNGLWDMAVQTESDVIARMALIPRVLEARGLDVTPAMIARLENAGDIEAVEILKTIYQDEIQHVRIGSKWFKHHCQFRNLNPKPTFLKMIKTHLHGELKGPFNIEARLLADFDDSELEDLINLSKNNP